MPLTSNKNNITKVSDNPTPLSRDKLDANFQELINVINDAGTVKAIADGKIKTFVSATAPTADEVGDLWFDSSNQYLPHRWDGTSWVDIHRLNFATNAQSLAGTATNVAANPAGVAAYVDQWGFVGSGAADFSTSGFSAAFDIPIGKYFAWETNESSAVAAGLPAYGGSGTEARHWQFIKVGNNSNRKFLIARQLFNSGNSYTGDWLRIIQDGNLGTWINHWTSRNFDPSNYATVSSLSAYSKYADFASANAGNGYCKLPNGIIFQWGSISVGANSSATGNFPITFPSSVFQCVGNKLGGHPSATDAATGGAKAISKSQYSAFNDDSVTETIAFIAIGI